MKIMVYYYQYILVSLLKNMFLTISIKSIPIEDVMNMVKEDTFVDATNDSLRRLAEIFDNIDKDKNKRVTKS